MNGADSDSAKMFTLAHELAHLWLGKEGLSGFESVMAASDRKEEQFCDAVAAEFLVPAAELTAYWPEVKRSARPFERIARRFKASPVVAARRAMDLGFVSRKKFFGFYKEYTAKEFHNKKKKNQAQRRLLRHPERPRRQVFRDSNHSGRLGDADFFQGRLPPDWFVWKNV